MTDREAYLSRLGRELRADQAAPGDLCADMVDDIPIGRRGVTVEITRSDLHGTACRLTVLAADPLPGHKRPRQSVFLFVHDVDRVIEALGTARAQLIEASAKRDAKKPKTPTPMRTRGAPPTRFSEIAKVVAHARAA